jgi:hypothetical protein
LRFFFAFPGVVVIALQDLRRCKTFEDAGVFEAFAPGS